MNKSIPVRKISAIKSAGPESGIISIRNLETILKGNDLNHDLHRHSFYFILAVNKGNGSHEIDFENYEIKSRTLFLLRPGQVHKLKLKSNSTGFIIEFDDAFFRLKSSITNPSWKHAFQKNYRKADTSNFTRIFGHLAYAYDEFTAKQDNYIEAIIANLDLFFIEYNRLNGKQKSSTRPGLYIQERFEDFQILLEQNIRSIKNVSHYASLSNLSPYQLNAIAKASVDKSVSEMITEQIMLEAKRSLLATSDQIKNIADDLGFEDTSYFIRFFKKHTGFSPDAFRKKFK